MSYVFINLDPALYILTPNDIYIYIYKKQLYTIFVRITRNYAQPYLLENSCQAYGRETTARMESLYTAEDFVNVLNESLPCLIGTGELFLIN